MLRIDCKGQGDKSGGDCCEPGESGWQLKPEWEVVRCILDISEAVAT